MTDDTTVLLCCRVADIEPGAQSTIATCDTCGAPVWIANSSPETTERICVPCFSVRMAQIGDETVQIMPLTDKQLKDIGKCRNA